jgi:hypothetical protein
MFPDVLLTSPFSIGFSLKCVGKDKELITICGIYRLHISHAINAATPENTREGSAFRNGGDHTVAKGEHDILINVMWIILLNGGGSVTDP